nr:hypothetical protein [uncultured archaeon]
MQYIATTFAHGNGPYSRIIDLGLAINREFSERRLPKMRVLVPLVYGERQRRIILEQFEQVAEEEPDRLLLDETYGKLLGEIFFKTGSYEENLRAFAEHYSGLEERVRNHLSSTFTAKTLDGRDVRVNGEHIDFEISHNPRVATGYQKSFYTTIALFSEILERTFGESSLKFDRDVLAETIKIAERIERDKAVHFIPEPFAFSYDGTREKREREIFTPPFIHSPKPDTREIPKGMYVTITGIDGLRTLFDEVSKFGIQLYCPDFINLQNADNRFSPEIISNPDILYHFARTGWSSVWLSHITETPLITPPYKEGDDPEIYFNERSVRKLGIATLFDSEEDPKKILEEANLQVKEMKGINRRLVDGYGTLDGIDYTARIIADFLEGKDISSYREVLPVLAD